jgi:hypothetical protein
MRLKLTAVGFFAAALLIGPAAHAFTVENKDAEGQYGVPKFDLEQQAKGFTKDGTNISSGKLYETPIPGGGTFQFGVSPNASFGNGLPFSMGASSSMQSRQEFDRRLAPPTSLDYNTPH